MRKHAKQNIERHRAKCQKERQKAEAARLAAIDKAKATRLAAKANRSLRVRIHKMVHTKEFHKEDATDANAQDEYRGFDSYNRDLKLLRPYVTRWR